MRKRDIIKSAGAILDFQNGGFNMANTDYCLKDTISQVMEGWLYRNKKSAVKTSTFNRLLASFNLLKQYPISNVRLLDLCTEDVQNYLNTLAEDEYSVSTIKKEYNLLTALLQFLIGEGVRVRPAHINAHVPKVDKIKKQTKQIEAYEPDEQRCLKEAIAKADTVGARAALLMMESGIRVGEALALRWSDILWQRRAISIHSTLVNLQSRKKCFVQNSTKSKSSRRIIPLSKSVLEMLVCHRRSGDGLVFTASDGETSIGYNSLRNQIRDVCELAGVEYRGMHVFRHTFATNAFYKGCNIKTLSKMLGHANVTITYNTYIHLYGDALEEMRSIVD